MLRGLDRVVASAGLQLLADDNGGAPDVVVVDLDRPSALEEVSSWRGRFPDVFIAGHVGAPRRELWTEAEQAGCDLVANRGAFASQLVRRLPPPGQPRRQRFALVEAADLPGRLGVVVRLGASPVGPVALYHVAGKVFAIEDLCPHAGATVSTGELEGTVVTCPGHGSRFDVRNGERVRGPADIGLRTFEVAEEDGFVYLLW